MADSARFVAGVRASELMRKFLGVKCHVKKYIKVQDERPKKRLKICQAVQVEL